MDQAILGNALFTVIGGDTYLGAHMAHHLRRNGGRVCSVPQEEPFQFRAETVESSMGENLPEELSPVASEWIVICLDPRMGFERYTSRLKQVLGELTSCEFAGDLCCFSSASICLAEGEAPITEHAEVYPRNEQDLALATGENILRVFSCAGKGYGVPHILRIGVPYGDEIGIGTPPGIVNRMVAEAKRKAPLRIPVTSDGKRSFTHISDLCEAAVRLMASEECPMVVNIPGEEQSLCKAASAIAAHYGVPVSVRGLSSYADPEMFSGNQHLSETLFREIVSWVPQHSLAEFLEEQTEA